jgi:predicted glutamine amidotransferase
MCRLFGLHVGRTPASATLWLLNAPDSLEQQSRRNPDGTGKGVYLADGRVVVDKQPIAAWTTRAGKQSSPVNSSTSKPTSRSLAA